MSEINIRRRHALTATAARQLAEQMAGELEQRFGLAFGWDGDALRFRRDGVQGALTVGDGEIAIHARLGFLLSLARGEIEHQIEASLDRALAGARPPGPSPDPASEDLA